MPILGTGGEWGLGPTRGFAPWIWNWV